MDESPENNFRIIEEYQYNDVKFWYNNFDTGGDTGAMPLMLYPKKRRLNQIAGELRYIQKNGKFSPNSTDKLQNDIISMSCVYFTPMRCRVLVCALGNKLINQVTVWQSQKLKDRDVKLKNIGRGK